MSKEMDEIERKTMQDIKDNDYTKDINFWKRLEAFVEDVQTGCCAGEEEKEMILNVCKEKLIKQ